MYRRSGVGAYPTDPYYDPARPSWLPYWIDDPTESANKAAYFAANSGNPLLVAGSPLLATTTGASPYTLPPAPPTIQPPDMATDPTGQSVNVDTQIAAQVAAENAALQQWAGAQSAATPVNPLSAGSLLNTIPSWLLWGGGAALVILFFMGGRR
jgi:hypothetical protein